ncbi:MAG TPA: two-component system response regulator [Methylophilaceae bacterium]|nr:two-component system response regulator [Methylophilaceae bacterium]HAJ73073.1 two-component system response regulator [Methylophilaceae bacterium]
MAIQKILVVDDSATDRFYLTEILEANGFDVEVLESGEACVEKAAGIAPDLIVMDIIMTGLTGFQAARTLTKDPATASIPIILTSGKLQVTDLAWAEKMGAKGCLQKPVDKTELMAAIKKLG